VRLPAKLSFGPRSPIAGRAVWGIADQGLSSLSNFALSILIARSATASAFGGFSVSLTAYAIILQVVRGLAGLPLSIRFSTESTPVWRAGASSAAGAALVLASVIGVAAAVVGLVLGGQIGVPMIVLGLSLPGLMVQDTWRFAFFAAKRGVSAFINDGVWTFAFLTVVAAGAAVFSVDATATMIIWGAAALLAAVYGCLQVAALPRPSHSRLWLADTKDIGLRFALETLIVTSGSQGAFFFIGIFSGLASLGAVRGASTLLGALNILFFGITIMGVPEAARTAKFQPARLEGRAALASAVLAGVACLWGIVLGLLPSSIGTALLGELWRSSHQFILPMTALMIGTGIQVGALIGLRGLGAAKISLRAALLSSPFVFGVAALTSATWGPTGGAWGLVVGRFIAAAMTWQGLRIALRRGSAGDVSPATTSPV
jgi:O-antigen/teichoic acid export membrane protein